MNNIKKYIPSSLKHMLWQYFLYRKHSRQNFIGKHVVISKDFICGQNCKIGDDVIIGREVILGNNVKIGKHAFIEKAEIADNSRVEGRVVFTGHGKGKIKIGKESYIGIYNVLDWSNDVFIGDYVHIAGPSTGIWTHSSVRTCLNGVPINNQSESVRPTAPIHIENNTWIGGNCTIYPGVRIGHHSIVAPNSAVTKNVEPHTMVGGVPASFVKKIVTGYHFTVFNNGK
jgi:acetyltransferase-like isoleucine patch superfamily enzyme